MEHVQAFIDEVEEAFNKLPERRALLEDRVTAVRATVANGTYTVTMDSPPSQYTDGLALNVRFPQANEENPMLEVIGEDGMSLGAKPIRDVRRQPLTANHISANTRAELYYVAHGGGYWIIGAGAAVGEIGPVGPPDGEFYILDTNHLGFRSTDGTPIVDFGPIFPKWRGPYSGTETYQYLDLVRSGSYRHLHVGLADTTGTATTDTSVWQRLQKHEAIPFETLPFATDLTWNVGTHPNAILTMTDNVASLTVTGMEVGKIYEMAIFQDATGGRTMPFPDTWLWPGGAAGVLSTDPNALDNLLIRRDDDYHYALMGNGWATA